MNNKKVIPYSVNKMHEVECIFHLRFKIAWDRRLDIVLLKKKKKNRNLFYERIFVCFFLIVCNI